MIKLQFSPEEKRKVCDLLVVLLFFASEQSEPQKSGNRQGEGLRVRLGRTSFQQQRRWSDFPLNLFSVSIFV